MTEKEYNGEKIVLALGFFDGIHLGHQKLIQSAIDIAKKEGWVSGVMTFTEHPLRRIFPSYAPWLISTNADKVRIMEAMGIDYVFLNPFTEALMHASPEDFIGGYLLRKYNVGHVVVGFNYTFGYKGAGDIKLLKALGRHFGFGVTVIPPCIVADHSVSSTLIRELISSGRVDEVPEYLGRDYAISGDVVRGKGLGHTVDIPTANLHLPQKVILPSSGVYYTKVTLPDGVYDGLTNLGFNPTFEKHPYSIETYIYDFDEMIYGSPMTLTFKVKIRGEIKFDSLEDLFAQIRSDIVKIDENYRHQD
ncbi:MAG: bifunctional riboflavin kinase/FAD synthetase [Eubacterium sp.]|nr:bifunctional riboflavin kinase/FAD synthetase [Eubacterium sp.]